MAAKHNKKIPHNQPLGKCKLKLKGTATHPPAMDAEQPKLLLGMRNVLATRGKE